MFASLISPNVFIQKTGPNSILDFGVRCLAKDEQTLILACLAGRRSTDSCTSSLLCTWRALCSWTCWSGRPLSCFWAPCLCCGRLPAQPGCSRRGAISFQSTLWKFRACLLCSQTVKLLVLRRASSLRWEMVRLAVVVIASPLLVVFDKGLVPRAVLALWLACGFHLMSLVGLSLYQRCLAITGPSQEPNVDIREKTQ